MERIDDLLTHQLKIIQRPDCFSFSMDAVLLAHFTPLPPKQGKMLDVCTGNGVIPLLVTTRTGRPIDAVEIQPKLADLARRSVQLNEKEAQITIYEADIRTFVTPERNGRYDVITMNPPYLPLAQGEQSPNAHRASARHEVHGTFEQLIEPISKLLRPGGKLALVHRPSRLVDLFCTLRKFRIEPKRIQFVHQTADAEASIVLIEAVRDGKPELKVCEPLLVYDNDKQYTSKLFNIYYPERNRK